MDDIQRIPKNKFPHISVSILLVSEIPAISSPHVCAVPVTGGVIAPQFYASSSSRWGCQEKKKKQLNLDI